ncbi:hypothetical protein [Bradyrhizobium sp. 151]|uniref:hypothetical protein n=1 Tax=Bradyrhizobium sp. 151 TaxID=2782626 RepID=UPI001FFA0055|nr:hypothetical protein [Bradyrhizobium sp. 151]MCK1658544.1 hypothetical protein [Bradyrhizobium sp. 151]
MRTENTMSHAADKGKFYQRPTVRMEWLRRIQTKTFCGRRDENHPSRRQHPLDPIDLHVAMRLLDHLNRKTGQLNPEHATIAAAIGASVETVWRSMARLAEHNFLKARARFTKGGLQTSSQYDLNLELDGHDATSSVTHPVRHRRRTRHVIGDVPGTSSMTDEPRGMNHGEDNHGELNARIPAAGADRHARSGSGVDRACGADRQRSDGYQQTAEQAEQDWINLNVVLPGTSEDAEHQPSTTADQGAKVHWHRLLKSGVPSSQILQAARGYLERRKADGQWQSGVNGFLLNFDPEQREDGSYPADEPHAANDNRQYDRASGDDLNQGVEVDV